MVKRRHAWETEDGTVFRTRREAAEYDARRRLDAAADELYYQLGHHGMGSNQGRQGTANVLKALARTELGRELLIELAKAGGNRHVRDPEGEEEDE